MTSILKIAAATAAGVLLSTAAYADTLTVVSTTQSVQPSATMTSKTSNAFNPGRNKIVFTALGKTCTVNSSGNPYGSGGGAGCNYTLNINNSNETMDLASNGNGCTTSAQFSSSCQ